MPRTELDPRGATVLHERAFRSRWFANMQNFAPHKNPAARQNASAKNLSWQMGVKREANESFAFKKKNCLADGGWPQKPHYYSGNQVLPSISDISSGAACAMWGKSGCRLRLQRSQPRREKKSHRSETPVFEARGRSRSARTGTEDVEERTR